MYEKCYEHSLSNAFANTHSHIGKNSRGSHHFMYDQFRMWGTLNMYYYYTSPLFKPKFVHV